MNRAFTNENRPKQLERRGYGANQGVTHSPEDRPTETKAGLAHLSLDRQVEIDIPVEVFEQGDHEAEREADLFFQGGRTLRVA